MPINRCGNATARDFKALSGLSLKGLRICGGRRGLDVCHQTTPTPAVGFKNLPPVKRTVISRISFGLKKEIRLDSLII
jgi:hypothetical protein